VARFGSNDRDRGLRRVSTVTKWLAAGSVAAVGALTAVVAAAAPGTSRSSTPNDSGASASSGASTSSGGNSGTGSTPTTTQPRVVDPGTDLTPSAPDDNGFVPPTDPPIRIHRRPVTNSGGS
jgi:hypothetical protein